MKKPRKHISHGPEYYIQRDLVEFLEARQWMVERMVGNMFQRGIPDLYVAHIKYGQRWIDVKVDGHYVFTKAQRIKWPVWEKNGVGIWILTGVSEEQYDRLFKPPNMRDYWNPAWEEEAAELDQLLSELEINKGED